MKDKHKIDELDELETAGELEAGEAMPDAEEMGFVDERPSSLNRYTIILVGLCLLGVVGVFLFGQKQKAAPPDQKQQAEVAKLDNNLSRLMTQKGEAKKAIKNTEEMISLFHQYPTNQQLGRDELQRNPFIRDENASPEAPAAAPEKGPDLAALQKSAAGLKLQSVLRGATSNQCLINGEVYQEGQEIKEFKVKSIQEHGVVLTAAEHDFVLKM